MPEYRLIDTAGGEIGIVADDRATIDLGETVSLPDGNDATVVDLYDDEEHGRDGGVETTLVVEPG